jgi:acyl-CoA hydrolase
VRVDVFREDAIGDSRELCTSGHFIVVAVDEDGKPAPVPPEG